MGKEKGPSEKEGSTNKPKTPEVHLSKFYMAPEKTITIHLLDGEASGLKTAELSSWNGQALIVPRARFRDISKLENCKKPAVYFLFYKGGRAYINQTKNFKEKLGEHINKKESLWHTAIGFIDQSGELIESHAKYLNSRCIEVAELANQYKLENETNSTRPKLPESNNDALNSFFENLKLILSSVGYPILQPQSEFICRGWNHVRGLGYMARNNKEFLVLKGSTVTVSQGLGRAHFEMREVKGFADTHQRARSIRADDPPHIQAIKRLQKIIDSGHIAKSGDGLYTFTKNYLFKSPSGAATIILGRNTNGWLKWEHAESGKTLDEIYRTKN